MLADSLAKALATNGADLERTPNDRAAATVDALMPDLIVLAGDAAHDRGAAVLAHLCEVSADAPPPVMVVCAPDLSGLASHPMPRHVGFLAPEGGMNECARRVQAVLDLVVDQNLEVCTLQQLADTVSSRAKPAVDASAAKPAAEKGRSPTQEYATAKGMAPLPKSAAAKNDAAPANDPSAPSAVAAKAASPGATTPQRAGTAQMPAAAVSGVTAKSTQQLSVVQPAAAVSSATAKSTQQLPAVQPAAAVSSAAAKSTQQLPAVQPAAAISGAAAKSTQQLPAVQPSAASARARTGTAQMAAVSGEPAKPGRPATAQMPIVGGAAAKGTAPSSTGTPATSRTGTAQMPAMQASATATATPSRTGTAQMPAMQASAAAAMSGKPNASRTGTAQLPAAQLEATSPAPAKVASPRTATLQTRAAQVDGIAAAISGALNAEPTASADSPSGELPLASKRAADPASQPIALANEAIATRTGTAQMPALDPAAASPVAGKPAPTLPKNESSAEAKVATSPKLPLIAHASTESFDDEMEPTIVGKLPLPPSAARAPNTAKSAFKRTLLNATPVQLDKSDTDAPTTSPKLGVINKPVLTPAVDTSSTDNAPTTPNPVLASALSKESGATGTLSSAPTGPNAIIADPTPTPDQTTNPFQAVIGARADAPNARLPLPQRDEKIAVASSAETTRPEPSGPPSASAALDDKPTLAPTVDSDHPTAPPISIALSEPPPVHEQLEAATVRPSGGEIHVTFSEPPQPLTEAASQHTRVERVRRPTGALEPVPAPDTRARNPFEPGATTQPRQDPSEPRLRRATSPLEPTMPTTASRPKQDGSEPRLRRATSPLEAVPAPQPKPEAGAERVRRPTSPLEPMAAATQPKQAAPVRRPTNPLEPVMAAAPAQPTPLAAVSGSGSKVRRDPLQAPAAWPDSSSAAVHDLPVTDKPRGSKWRVLALAGGIAAVGCGVLLFQLRGDGGADHLGGRAAADALQYAPAPAAAEPVAPVAVANVAPGVPATPSAAPAAPQPSAAYVERGPAQARATAPAANAAASHAPPGSPQQLVDDGRVLMRQGRLGLAEGMFLKALATEPNSSAAMAEIVRVHLARRDGAEAVRWATRLTALPGNQSVAQLLLGDAEALHGDSTAAHDAWTRAARAGNATARQRLDDE